MPDLLDINQTFGSDIVPTLSGDLGTVSVVERSKQRVLRRLLTSVKGYIFHLEYGAGVPAYVGRVLNLAELKAVIVGQMRLEASVIQTPPPTVALQVIINGVAVDVSYHVSPDRQPASLSFDVSA